MVSVPIGLNAYKRDFAAEPEVQLVNRYVERTPTNLKEHVTLVGRPGTALLQHYDGGDGGNIRGLYSKEGLFDTALFVVSGPNLYRTETDESTVTITGEVLGTTKPYMTWMRGIGYEYAFIADTILLQYYGGGTHATGTLTAGTPSPKITNSHIIKINTTYYGWNANVETNTPDGTASHPWLTKLGATDTESLANMANMLQFDGTRGTDFSSDLPGPSDDVYVVSTSATTLVVAAWSEFTDGNSIATTVEAGSNLSWGHATLTGGGTHALVQVPMPDGSPAKALASLAGFVLVSVGNSRRVYFIRPGEVTIDPLDFFEKESNPDNVLDMLTVGDRVLICGNGSSEWWYATGDTDAPFAPTAGNAYARGVLEGSPVVVRETVILVGNDGVVYEISGAGVKPISDNGIGERLRTQLRRDAGLS